MNTYISITITYFRNLPPEVHYYRNDYVNPVVDTWDKLTITEANQLMWELIKLGGQNHYKSNMFDNGISTRNVTFYGCL